VRVLRTPEARFDGLSGFEYEPGYAEVADGDGGRLRMAYYDVGPRAAQPVLLLHGEPSWSYLWREVIPPLVAAGLRAVAVDLVGFGRSDKPSHMDDHTYARHVEWVRALVFDVLDLRDTTVVGHDWGGLIGLRLVAEHQDRFARVVAANTGLPTGDQEMPEVWHRFKDAARNAETFDVARSIASGCVRPVSEETKAAYDAPFPDESFKAGPRAMPGLVPITPNDPATGANRAAWGVLAKWTKPFLVAFSDSDPITGPMAPVLMGVVPGARDVEHPTIAGAGHFLQEDAGGALGQEIAAFVTAR
jgi:haloalkane dehalogenase